MMIAIVRFGRFGRKKHANDKLAVVGRYNYEQMMMEEDEKKNNENLANLFRS